MSKTKVSQTRKANIKINQYIVEKTLGKGSFAKVKLVTDSTTGNKFAIKVMNKNALKNKKSGTQGKNAYDCVLEELKVLERLEHPNIIYLHEIIDDNRKEEIYLVTEYHSRGSLGDMMREKNLKFEETNRKHRLNQEYDQMQFQGMNEKNVRLYFIDMLKALHYCHKIIKVIHRDIKPDNIMINHNDEAVLIDFGVSALFDEQEDDMIGTTMGSFNFFAPEMIKRKKGTGFRGEQTDIWALGITLFYLICGQYPHQNAKSIIALKECIINKPIDFSLIKSPNVRTLLEHILEKNPEKRANLHDILQSDWVTNNGQENIDLE